VKYKTRNFRRKRKQPHIIFLTQQAYGRVETRHLRTPLVVQESVKTVLRSNEI